MNLKDIVSVSGLPGLYKMVTSRNNGLIIADMDTGKTRFASIRKHQFTPLESIAIYTDRDSVELSKIFESMILISEDFPPVSPNAPSDEIKDYFEEVLPTYDKTRVHVGDMKKIIKWYNFLNDRNLLTGNDADEEE